MQSKELGIMVCETQDTLPFPEKKFYRKLCLIGANLGITVFVFSPERIHWDTKSVTGFTYNKKTAQWEMQTFALPKLIYDRCFYKNREQHKQHQIQILKLKNTRNVKFLGHGLKGKWGIHQTLLKDQHIVPYIPNTQMFNSPKILIQWLKNKNEAFLKPQGGSQGRGVMHVIRYSPRRYTIKARTQQNRSIELEFDRLFNLLQWIKGFIGRRKYIIQDYLTLVTNANQAFDIRSLVQKNGKGEWHHTGMAIRIGKQGSITSNLHGGGSAAEVFPFLEKQYGKETALYIISIIQELSKRIPPYLEQQYGRLIELGLDFGVDQQGKVWILEVNSKPGRAVFLYLRNMKQKKKSIGNPMYYARYLLDRQIGG